MAMEDMTTEVSWEYNVDFSGRNAPVPVQPKSTKRKYMQYQTDSMVEQIRPITTDLSSDIIRNVLAYTKQLVKPGTEDIDENIFTAQMAKYFKITDAYLIMRIYEVIRLKKQNQRTISVMNYAKLICIFISEVMSPKIEYAFRVYDVRGCGHLNTFDLQSALKPLLAYTHISASTLDEMPDHQPEVSDVIEDLEKKTLSEIVNLLLSMIDTNNDRSIDLGEFHAIVKRHPLMLECLGPCLPGKQERDDFINLLTDKSSFEVSAYFRHERKVSLHDPTSDKTLYDSLYPFQLEFP